MREVGGPHSLELKFPDSEAGSQPVLLCLPLPLQAIYSDSKGWTLKKYSWSPTPATTSCVIGEINGTSLLGERDDNLPSNFTPVFLSQLLKNNSNENVTSKCNGNEQCIYDVLATGNTQTGLHTSMIFTTYQQMNTTIRKWREA